MISSRFSQVVSAVLLVSVLGSCTNIKDDGTRTRTEGALGGAAVGAIAGALIGAASGNAGRGALIGAGVGTAGGLAYGDAVAKKKQRYIYTEDQLDAAIASARRTNQRARSYNNTLASRIDRLSREVAVAKSSGNKSVLRQKKAEIINLQRESRGELQKVDTQIQSGNQILGKAKSPGLRQEVSGLTDTRRSLNRNVDRLASLNNEIDV